MPKVLLVRDDDGNGLLCVGMRMHAQVRDEVACLVYGLQPLERDVLQNAQSIASNFMSRASAYLSARKFDQVLDSTQACQNFG